MIIILQWIKENAFIVLFDAIFFVLLVIFLCYLTSSFRKKNRIHLEDSQPKKATSISSHDIKAIAGDDVFTTQLDLARAYIEMGKQKIAKQILDHVLKNGNSDQQQLAERLLVNM